MLPYENESKWRYEVHLTWENYVSGLKHKSKVKISWSGEGSFGRTCPAHDMYTMKLQKRKNLLLHVRRALWCVRWAHCAIIRCQVACAACVRLYAVHVRERKLGFYKPKLSQARVPNFDDSKALACIIIISFEYCRVIF